MKIKSNISLLLVFIHILSKDGIIIIMLTIWNNNGLVNGKLNGSKLELFN